MKITKINQASKNITLVNRSDIKHQVTILCFVWSAKKYCFLTLATLIATFSNFSMLKWEKVLLMLALVLLIYLLATRRLEYVYVWIKNSYLFMPVTVFAHFCIFFAPRGNIYGHLWKNKQKQNRLLCASFIIWEFTYGSSWLQCKWGWLEARVSFV